MAYGDTSVDFQGPIPTGFTQSSDGLVIEFDDGNGNLDVRINDGFEVINQTSTRGSIEGG